MKIKLFRSCMTAFVILFSAGFVPYLNDLSVNHFGISRSIPAQGEEAQSVSRIEVWFTQNPQENSVSIRVVGPEKSLVPDAIFQVDPEDASRFTANLGRFLSSGEYEVIWRGIGQDGHVVNGDWDFSVAGQ